MLKTLRNGTIAAIVALVVIFAATDGGGPLSWHGNPDDDTSRTVTLIALAQNDTLTLSSVRVTTSKHGRVLNLDDEELLENSWDYDVQLAANESISVQMLIKVYSLDLGDRAFVRCKIIDNGDTVRDHRAEVPETRRDAYTECNYTA